MKLPMTVACWDYDRTRALFDGRVRVEGCELNLLNLPVEETFFRALKSTEFDVAELSLSSYTVQRSRGVCAYTAIPVFLSRMFRHSAVYVNRNSGIRTPQDLVGKKVGVPEYQLTAPVWVRGILEDEYGVSPNAMRWVTGGVEATGRREKIALALPHDLSIAPIDEDIPLNRALVDGVIDALIAPRAPSAFVAGNPAVGLLFDDVRAVERAYYVKTGIFPIMHVVGIRTALLIEYPWLASSVMKAFTAAKELALRDLAEVTALKTSLPWLPSEYAETVRLMGPDFWSYGIRPNRSALETFVGYHHAQGLSARRMTVEELFAPTTLEQVVI